MIVYKDRAFCARNGCKVRSCHRHKDNVDWDEARELGLGVAIADLWKTEIVCPISEPKMMDYEEVDTQDGFVRIRPNGQS